MFELLAAGPVVAMYAILTKLNLDSVVAIQEAAEAQKEAAIRFTAPFINMAKEYK